jgi:hypothetical protein
MYWIELARVWVYRHAFVNTVMKIRIPLNRGTLSPFKKLPTFWQLQVKDKGTVHRITGLEVPEGEYSYSSTLSLTSTLDGVGDQRQAPAALPPGKTRYPLYRRLGGPHYWSEQVRKISPPTGIRSPDRPARNESLYRLRYSGSSKTTGTLHHAVSSVQSFVQLGSPWTGTSATYVGHLWHLTVRCKQFQNPKP